MNRVPVCIAAFTLVEMMLSIALGSVIIYTAFAGFRVTTQTIALANRLSLENSMLRAGYFEAQHQLDFWTNLDDPTKPDTERPLKSDTDSVGNITDWTGRNRPRGLPFTPMQVLSARGVWPKAGTVPRPAATSLNGATLPVVTGARVNEITPRDLQSNPPGTTTSTDPWDGDRGWDPTYSWSPHDPRTWFRVNMAEKTRDWREQRPRKTHNDPADPTGQTQIEDYPAIYVPPDMVNGSNVYNTFPPLINGRYIIFSNTSVSAASPPQFTILPDPNISGPLEKNNTNDPNNVEVTVSYAGYPADGIHTWYSNQVKALTDAMGFAAMCEYLPPNALYAWHIDTGDTDARSESGWLSKYGIDPGWNVSNWNGNQRTARGIYRNTYPVSYGYINPRSWNDYRANPPPVSGTPATGDTLRQRFHQHFDTDNASVVDTGTGWQPGNDLQWLMRHVGFPESLMDIKPDVWPDVQVSVGRFIKNAHHVAVARVRRFSPLTGELIELSWCGVGTTLRGARQQRNRGTGWAVWDNRSGSVNDPTLDTP